MKTRILLPLLLLLALPSLASDLTRKLDAYTKPFADADQLSGSLLIAKSDKVIYERSWGQADFELGVPVTADTRFCVASITKPLTGIVARHLIAQGKLSESDKLSKYLPNFPRGDQITIAHLMEHQAGIPHRIIPEEAQTRPYTAADMVRLAANRPLDFDPGSKESYSSGGYTVLARVLEIAGGASYADLVEQIVFRPAGVTRSVAVADRVQALPGRAISYQPTTPREHTPFRDVSFLVGAGSAYMTPRDIFRVMQHLRQGKYLGAPEKEWQSEKGIRWSGITNGYRAYADYYKDTDVTVIYTANVYSGAADAMRRDLPRLAAGENVPPPTIPRPTIVPPAAAQRAALEGLYKLGFATGIPLRFAPDGRLARFGDRVLLPTGPDAFFCVNDYEEVKIERGPDGSVTGLAWGPPGKGPRVERTGPLPAAD